MIELSQVLTLLKKDKNLISAPDMASVKFDSLSYDSRKVTSNTLFFAKGRNFKSDYLSNLTAPCYLSEIDYQVSLPVILVHNIKHAMSLIAQAFYDYPQNKLKTLAFTGTKGKTTSAYFAKSILDEMNDTKTALLSTAYTTLDGKTFTKSELTTPESLDLFAMMAKAVENKMTHLVMEVSSQAYKTERVYALDFDIGVWLNISPDHIGPLEHPNFEDYFACKRQLLDHARFAIVNSESDRFESLAAQVTAIPHIFYGAHSENQITESNAYTFTTSGLLSDTFNIQLIGRFNQENALAASLAAQHFGASLTNIQAGLAKTIVPGRMETLDARSGAKIYIDYAHNGVSLENLVTVVETHHTGNLYLVLGATGNKGESRRKDFAEVIERHHSLSVMLTQDDSNYEDPTKIAQEIAQHITRPVNINPDRAAAITWAIRQATGPSDAVIIAGKGADTFQLVNGIRTPYPGDRTIAERYI
ncbi:MAG: UDP-N-acetylmuramoyl-L-alanyl-D-glutamate--L-lysine ligase [Streptococcaceae bacterium]|nr:UDP-N-acetylmuramoyl-L-alanyl-D-glutamate--L-lysine ligase [Streptococcaceae bacterium]